MRKEEPLVRKRRAMTTEAARQVKLAGHEAENEFAELIGGNIYVGSRKRDVVDKQGNIHSVKSGVKKWQIFLSAMGIKLCFFKKLSFIAAK